MLNYIKYDIINQHLSVKTPCFTEFALFLSYLAVFLSIFAKNGHQTVFASHLSSCGLRLYQTMQMTSSLSLKHHFSQP
jgi:hypothetical protein